MTCGISLVVGTKPIGDRLSRFLAQKAAEGLRPRSLGWWQNALEPVLRDLGPEPTAEAAVEWLVTWREHKRPSPGYYRARVVAIRAYLAVQGVDLGLKLPRAPRSEGSRLSEAQILRLMAQFGPTPRDLRDRAILALMLDCGLRLGEVAALRWGDLDWEAGHLAITGKGGHRRRVWFGQAARAALGAWRGACDGTAAMFPGRGGHLGESAIWRIVKHRGRAVRLQISPHGLRRTFATQWVRQGRNVFALQRLLGHSSLEMVRRYVILAEGDLALASGSKSILDLVEQANST